MQRRKGAGYEREVCDDIFQVLGRAVARNLGQARDSGNDIDLAPYLVECKRRRRISVEEWLRQCERACEKKGGIPIVVCRADGSESFALIRWRDLLPLLREELK